MFEKISSFFELDRVSAYLQELAEQNYFISSPQTNQYVQKFILNYEKILTSELTRYEYKNISLKTYGSFRSNFSLKKSDIDICIFCEKEIFPSERKLIETTLWKIEKFFKMNQD